MPTKLPPPVEAYFSAKTHNDIDAMSVPFAESAIVQDEGKEMRGLTAIREWMKETNRKYRYTIEVTGVTENATTTTVTCRLAGDFPGSPVDVRYALALKNGKIASLEIS
jgi:SnoaL-like domain